MSKWNNVYFAKMFWLYKTKAGVKQISGPAWGGGMHHFAKWDMAGDDRTALKTTGKYKYLYLAKDDVIRPEEDFIGKDGGKEFVANAIAATRSNNKRELWYLAQMMCSFWDEFEHLNEKHYFEKIRNSGGYTKTIRETIDKGGVVSPWSRSVSFILKSFETHKIWDVLEKIMKSSSKEWLGFDLYAGSSLVFNKVPEYRAKQIEIINKIVPYYDLDDGGLDLSKITGIQGHGILKTPAEIIDVANAIYLSDQQVQAVIKNNENRRNLQTAVGVVSTVAPGPTPTVTGGGSTRTDTRYGKELARRNLMSQYSKTIFQPGNERILFFWSLWHCSSYHDDMVSTFIPFGSDTRYGKPFMSIPWFRRAIKLYDQVDPYASMATVLNEIYQEDRRWKEEIYEKTRAIVKHGMPLNNSPMSFVKHVNQYQNKERFAIFDKHYKERLYTPYIRWGDSYYMNLWWWTAVKAKMSRNHKEQRPQTALISADALYTLFSDGKFEKNYGGNNPCVWLGNQDKENDDGRIRGYEKCDRLTIIRNGKPFVDGKEFRRTYVQGSPETKSETFSDNNTYGRAPWKVDLHDPKIGLKSYDAVSAYIDKHIDNANKGTRDGTDSEGFYGKKDFIENYGMKLRAYNSLFDENGEVMDKGIIANAYNGMKTALSIEMRKKFEDRKSQRELFNEATTYAAFSFSYLILSALRDDLLIYHWDYITKITNQKDGTWSNDSPLSESSVKGLHKSYKKTLEKDLDQANQAGAADQDKLTDDEIEERQIFYKQCFLLMNMEKLSKAYQSQTNKEVEASSNGDVTEIHKQGNEYSGRIRLIDVSDSEPDRASLMNKLTSPKGADIDSFFSIRPDLLSSLVPQIRLFKVFTKENEGTLKELEFDFPKNYNPDIESYRAKGSGKTDKWEFGVKDFSFSFDGTSPATARNDISAELSLYFRDFNDLIKERSVGDFNSNPVKNNLNSTLNDASNKYRFLDLILFPGSVHHNSYEHPFMYDSSRYRIRVDVGWVLREDPMFEKLAKESGTSAALIKAALEKINKSFYLNMIDHDLDFAVDGSVNIKIKYRAYIESAGKSVDMDVLATPEVNSVRKQIQLELNQAWNNCTPEQMYELMNTYKTMEKELIKKSYQSIVYRMLRRRRLQYTFSKLKDKKSFSQLGYFEDQPELVNGSKASNDTENDSSDSVTEMKTELQSISENKSIQRTDTFSLIDGKLRSFKPESISIGNPNAEVEVVNYFFLGDLLHTLMDCMFEPPEAGTGALVGDNQKEAVKNTILALSSFSYEHPLNPGTPINMNIASVPIALDYFIEFFTKHVIEGERRTYPIMHFIRDITNKLLVDIMYELCIKSMDVETKLRFQTTSLLATPDSSDPRDPLSLIDYKDGTVIRDLSTGYNRGYLPFNSSLAESSIDAAYNYIVVYPVTNNNVTSGNKAPTGNRIEDEKNGIRHLHIGRDRGLVKTIKFSKVDMQYIREARYFNHGYNGLMQLGSVYKATIEMVGNTMFYPGMTVFINPISLAGEGMDPTIGPDPSSNQMPSLANALGIGGYHLITKVQSTVGRGKFNTTVEAMFYYSGDSNSMLLKSNRQKMQKYREGKSSDQLEIDNLEKRGAKGQNEEFCQRIINIRQQHLQDIFAPEFSTAILDVSDSEKIENSIYEASARKSAFAQQTSDAEDLADQILEKRKSDNSDE